MTMPLPSVMRFLFRVCLLLLATAGCDDSPTRPSATPPQIIAVSPASGGTPTLTSLSPSTIVAGTSTTATLTGSNFIGGSTTVTVSGGGVIVSDVSVTGPTSLTARLATDAGVDIGARSVTVTTPGGTTTAQTITINPTQPAITSATATSATPGSTVSVTFRGTGFVPGATTVSVSGGGVTVIDVSVAGVDHLESGPMVAGTGTSVTATLVIDRNATLGPRAVTVSTAGGNSAPFIFMITAPSPVIGSFTANPVIIQRGASSRLAWRGILNATSCNINIGIGAVPCADDGVTITPSTTTEYMLTAIGAGGREWTYVTVNVEEPVTVAPHGTQTFIFTGAAQDFTVPAGVTSITIEAAGAQGGAAIPSNGVLVGGAGGNGGTVTATIAVTPGDVLRIFVGGQGAEGDLPITFGAGGFNGGGASCISSASALECGGGGGGASDVRRTPYALGDRLVVAGGGGGGGATGSATNGGPGGAGGGLTAANGGSVLGATGGGGGTQAAGGAGGVGHENGSAGGSGIGGAGGVGAFTRGGGGGGGYFGGGGGANSNLSPVSAGGGGGSSFTTVGATAITHTSGNRGGHGQVRITW